jgi:hypothetical protein
MALEKNDAFILDSSSQRIQSLRRLTLVEYCRGYKAMLATLSGVAQTDSPCRARKAKPQKRTNTMLSPFTMLVHTVCRGVD